MDKTMNTQWILLEFLNEIIGKYAIGQMDTQHIRFTIQKKLEVSFCRACERLHIPVRDVEFVCTSSSTGDVYINPGNYDTQTALVTMAEIFQYHRMDVPNFISGTVSEQEKIEWQNKL